MVRAAWISEMKDKVVIQLLLATIFTVSQLTIASTENDIDSKLNLSQAASIENASSGSGVK